MEPFTIRCPIWPRSPRSKSVATVVVRLKAQNARVEPSVPPAAFLYVLSTDGNAHTFWFVVIGARGGAAHSRSNVGIRHIFKPCENVGVFAGRDDRPDVQFEFCATVDEQMVILVWAWLLVRCVVL